ncbi:MAG: zinc ribbon domain-containing protein [Lachnospiraceae bacterium]|nr:zinc ribbon domain-containing protein [Lachnospiraceae bacterium]
MALINCYECGKEISDHAEVCPICGAKTQYGLQKEEDNQRQIMAKKKTQKGKIIAVIIIIAVCALAVFIGIKMHNKKQADKDAANASKYKANLSAVNLTMLNGAAAAESAGNLIKSVWYNAIYKEKDYTTDKYTIKDYPFGTDFVDDFNIALANLFADDDFTSDISKIEDNQKRVADIMKDLKNPPKGYEEAYKAIKECYDAYLTLTNLATDPTGSLQTFSSNFNDADSIFMTKYNAVKLYLN